MISVYNVYTATAHVGVLYSVLHTTTCCAISHACTYTGSLSLCVAHKFTRSLTPMCTNDNSHIDPPIRRPVQINVSSPNLSQERGPCGDSKRLHAERNICVYNLILGEVSSEPWRILRFYIAARGGSLSTWMKNIYILNAILFKYKEISSFIYRTNFARLVSRVFCRG